jgi:Zn-dependent protease with chaperone function
MTTPARITADWFDGRHGRAQPVEVWLDGATLHYGDRSAQLAGLAWPERFDHGRRQILLPEAGLLAFADAMAFDAWAQASGREPSRVERWQLSGWLALASLAFAALVLAVAWRWGLPWAADRLVARVPLSAEQPIGEQAMKLIDQQWLRPSALSAQEQDAWRARLSAMLSRARETQGLAIPEHFELQFRKSTRLLGPNAFALPGGTLCVTDELLQMLKDEPDAVLTILGHELGHVQHRHGLRLAARAAAVTIVVSVWMADYSNLLNGLPTLLATASYSRDHEREADAYARQLALAGGVDPSRIAVFFKRVRERYGPQDADALAISFSSHPADDERVRFFEQR